MRGDVLVVFGRYVQHKLQRFVTGQGGAVEGNGRNLRQIFGSSQGWRGGNGRFCLIGGHNAGFNCRRGSYLPESFLNRCPFGSITTKEFDSSSSS